MRTLSASSVATVSHAACRTCYRLILLSPERERHTAPPRTGAWKNLGYIQIQYKTIITRTQYICMYKIKRYRSYLGYFSLKRTLLLGWLRRVVSSSFTAYRGSASFNTCAGLIRSSDTLVFLSFIRITAVLSFLSSTSCGPVYGGSNAPVATSFLKNTCVQYFNAVGTYTGLLPCFRARSMN